MSEKIPISLRNSDLFLNSRLTDSNKEDKYIDNVKSLISKRGPSLGENNYFKSLHAFSSLFPLQPAPGRTKAKQNQSRNGAKVLVSPLVTLPGRTQAPLVLSPVISEKTTTFQGKSKDKKESQDQKLNYKIAKVQDTYPLRYKLQTKLMLTCFELNNFTEQEGKEELTKQYKKKFLDTALNQAKSLTNSQFYQEDIETVHSIKPSQGYYFSLPVLVKPYRFFKLNFYSLYLRSFLYKINRGIFSGFSQEFLIVAINLILFSVLAIVQRSHYGKGSSTIYKKKDFLAILCASKLPNLTTSYGMAPNTKQSLCWYPKTNQLVGSFLGQSDISPCVNNNKNKKEYYRFEQAKANTVSLTKQSDNKSEALVQGPNQSFAFVTGETKTCIQPLLQARLWYVDNKTLFPIKHSKKLPSKCNFEMSSHLQEYQTLAKNKAVTKVKLLAPPVTQPGRTKAKLLFSPAPPGAPVKKKASLINRYVIKPWYCIKANNIWNNHIIATRSIKQTTTKNTFYKKQTISKFQYYIPYNTSQQRIFAESDTIPEKKGSIHSKISTEQSKNKLKSSCITSEMVLKRGFYKYGFFLIHDTGSNQNEVLVHKSRNGASAFVSPFVTGPNTSSACVTGVNQNFVLVSPGGASNKSKAFVSPCVTAFLTGLQSTKFVLPRRFLSFFYRINSSIKSHIQYQQSKYTPFFNINKTLFSLGLTWSRYNLEKSKIVTFIQVRDPVPILNFLPDVLVQNIFVSGYQFPELQRKEIGSFFRKLAIFGALKNPNIDLHFQVLNNNITSEKEQETILFWPQHTGNNSLNVDPHLSSESLMALKLQYTQVNLDEIESVKKLFEQMGQDYEHYMRQPKDSLPAMIISPSLEDDREIEEEGIRIFRKRDLMRKKNSKDTVNSNSENHTFTENLFISKNQNSERQDHQTLVKNALRQAQEEIDDIAKKEEKGSEKEKQVIPPLTRLEALYTIRQREKKYEQAKNLKTDKGNSQAKLTFTKKSFPIFKELFLYSDKLNTNCLNGFQFVGIHTPHILSKLGDEKSNKTRKSVTKQSTVDTLYEAWFEQKSLPLFCRTDRKHSFFGEMSLPANKITAKKQKQVFQQKGNPLAKLNTKNTELVTKNLFCTNGAKLHFLLKTADNQSSDLVQNNQNQKANQSFSSISAFVTGASLVKDNQAKSFYSTAATVPFSLLSPLYISSKTHQKKNESLQFKVGMVRTNIVPPVVWEFEDGTNKSGNKTGANKSEAFVSSFGPGTSHLTSKKELERLGEQRVTPQLDSVKGPNRIYFYDNLSQNKACQGSTPKIKGTPLESPVYHRVWQPKRMEPSTFRVLQRSQKTPVVPRISQNDWKTIIEWQLKKYFFEEEKRLRPLSKKTGTSQLVDQLSRGQAKENNISLPNNNNKRFKITKINLYLPWISITKPGVTNFLLEGSSDKKVTKKSNLDLTFVDGGRKSSSLIEALYLPESHVLTTSLIKNKVETKPSFVTYLQNGLDIPLPEWHNAETRLLLTPQKEEQVNTKFKFYSLFYPWSEPKHHRFICTELSNANTQSTMCYWRLPTKQNLFAINKAINKKNESKRNSCFFALNQDCIQRWFGKTNSLSLQPKNSKQSQIQKPHFQKGVVQKVFRESLLFESVTGYSWLFIYIFVSVLMFKQLFKWVYQAGAAGNKSEAFVLPGLKDFFINFLNSEFGRSITSEEFRYSVQNVPLKEFYRPKKRLQELFSLDKNKVQLLEIVWFLRNHCQGRHGPRGVLLVGPPGVENVSVVQAIAGEAEVPIIVQSLEKIAQDNEPQRQLEQLYMRAHKQAPCVLFLDQLDTIGARRDQLFTDKTQAHNLDYKAKLNVTSPGHKSWSYSDFAQAWSQQSSGNLPWGYTNSVAKEQNNSSLKNKLNVVLRLLTILDGITQSSGVVTVATARDITTLDPALLRPKRFDRKIYLSLPNKQDRVRLFKIQTQNLGHTKQMPWDYLSLQTENMNAADIQSAINYSLFRAVLKKSVHTVETLEYGIDCVKSLTEKRVTTM